MVSDGVHAAQPRGYRQFGEAKLDSIIRSLGFLPPPEAARQLIREVLAYHDTGELQDDAVVVVFDWST